MITDSSDTVIVCILLCTYLSSECVFYLSLDLRNQSIINMVAAQQHETWATLGFLRGVSSQKMFGRAFCSSEWIDLMMGVIKKASPLAMPRPTTRPLLKQVCICLNDFVVHGQFDTLHVQL